MEGEWKLSAQFGADSFLYVTAVYAEIILREAARCGRKYMGKSSYSLFFRRHMPGKADDTQKEKLSNEYDSGVYLFGRRICHEDDI